MVRAPEPGAKGVLAKPVKQLDENVATVRLLNLPVAQREDLDRAWDALMDRDPNVVGGLLLRLPPVAVSIP